VGGLFAKQAARQSLLTCLSLALGIQFSRVAIIGFASLALPLLFASRDLMKTAVTSAVNRDRVRGCRVTVLQL
jgi:hypothetical protein